VFWRDIIERGRKKIAERIKALHEELSMICGKDIDEIDLF
jgi:hypothetical protein